MGMRGSNDSRESLRNGALGEAVTGLKDKERGSEKLSGPQAENTDTPPLSVRYYQHTSTTGVKKFKVF